jgi:uncharacterized protein
MIAFDTNILVYAHREDSEWHEAADRALAREAESGRPWAIPWACLHEFLAVVTHPRIFDPPTPLTDALQQVMCWLEIPSLVTLSEETGYWDALRPLVESGQIRGPQIHDARIAALCMQHGVRELWSADRDFSRIQGITVINPLLAKS